MDSAGSDRPQRRTALGGRELGRYGIEIAALSETRFAEIGEIKEVGAGYTFFWSGRKSNRKTMNRNWSNQKANPALKTKAGNK